MMKSILLAPDESSIIEHMNTLIIEYEQMLIQRLDLRTLTGMDSAQKQASIFYCKNKFYCVADLMKTMLEERIKFMYTLRKEEEQITDFMNKVKKLTSANDQKLDTKQLIDDAKEIESTIESVGNRIFACEKQLANLKQQINHTADWKTNLRQQFNDPRYDSVFKMTFQQLLVAIMDYFRLQNNLLNGIMEVTSDLQIKLKDLPIHRYQDYVDFVNNLYNDTRGVVYIQMNTIYYLWIDSIDEVIKIYKNNSELFESFLAQFNQAFTTMADNDGTQLAQQIKDENQAILAMLREIKMPPNPNNYDIHLDCYFRLLNNIQKYNELVQLMNTSQDTKLEFLVYESQPINYDLRTYEKFEEDPSYYQTAIRILKSSEVIRTAQKTKVQAYLVLGETEYELRAIHALIFKICDIWIAAKKLKFANETMLQKNVNDKTKVHSLRHWLTYFVPHLTFLVKYCPNINDLVDQVHRSSLALNTILSQGGYPMNSLMVAYNSTIPEFEDYLKALKIESGGNWPEENADGIDISLLLLIQEQAGQVNFNLPLTSRQQEQIARRMTNDYLFSTLYKVR